MKIAIAALLTLPLVSLFQGDSAQSQSSSVKLVDNREAVERAITDYVLGFYEARPDLLERGVSKDLKKMGYWRKEGDTKYSNPLHMTFDQATALAKSWNDKGQQGDDLEYEITIFEVTDKTASAKLKAKWGMDYFQLAKEKDGAWKIHHVLWQSHPPKQTTDDGGY